MIRDILKSSRTDLSGNILKSSGRIISVCLFNLFFSIYCFTVAYLLVIDTSVISEISLFNNKFFLAGVCAAVIIIGFVLFVYANYLKFKRDIWFLSFYRNINAEDITVSFSIKIATIYTLKAIKKFFYSFIFITPGCVLGYITYLLANHGAETRILTVSAAASAIITLSGTVVALIFQNRYSLVPYFSACDRNASVKNIFKESISQMNLKCFNLFKLKIRNIPKRIISFFIFPSFYCLPLCYLSETQLITDKTNSLIRRKTQREKAIVYLIGNQGNAV